MKIFSLLAVLLAFPMLGKAELSPSAYEGMQDKAPEFLKIEILRVSVEPGPAVDLQKIDVVALVLGVARTATDVKVNDIINISYTVANRAKGWVGPGEIPVPKEKDQSVAYLSKSETGDYTPVAGRMSFSNF